MVIKLLIISEVLFLTGLIVGYLRYGLTRSISALYDKLEEDPDTKGWWFTAWQIAFCLPLIVSVIILTIQGNIIWQGIILGMAATFIIFSAIAGDTEEHEVVMRVHVVGATGGIFLGAVFMASIQILGLIVAILAGIGTYYMIRKPVKNHTYWIEVKWYHLVTVSIAAASYGITYYNSIIFNSF